MESIQEEWNQGEVGKRRKMELKINSPTSSIMKPFSPTASPLSSPLSSPTKSGRAKKTISFLLPDTQDPAAAAEKVDEERKEEKLEEKAKIEEEKEKKEENREEEVGRRSISGEKQQKHVYEYPDLNASASGYRFQFVISKLNVNSLLSLS